jgi:hypothetical protein
VFAKLFRQLFEHASDLFADFVVIHRQQVCLK